MAPLSLPPLSVYYCYNPVDLDFCKALDIHLDPLKRRGWIQTWDDQQIPVGQERERERDSHLHTAHLMILLVSADFLASESGVHVMQVAIQRHHDGDAVVIPILVRAANWEETDLQALQVLPREQKAITAWLDQDDIWREIAREIQRIIEAMRQWVFVVSSPEDQVFVEQLRQDMIPSGILLWYLEEDQDEEAQRNAMHTAFAAILVASPDASKSHLVKTQLALVAAYRRPILVVWARGEDWRTSNPGKWSMQEVVDMREKRYEAARKVLLARLRQEVVTFPPLIDEPHTEPRNPYKGLHAFTRDDADDFFGREALIDQLTTAIETMLTLEQKGNQHERLLTVIGPSGSGKSSVVMAGLLPRLQKGAIFESAEWIYLDPMYPGTHPLEALAVSLAPQFPARSVLALRDDFAADSARALHLLACQLARASQKKVVLVVDQFEEVFTLTTSEQERQHFLDLLITAATEPSGPVLLLLMLRADFYDRPMQYPTLHQLIDKHHLSILPMDIEDLRRAIEQPARLPDVQLTFEGDLVGDLLFEIRGQAGALPLLQFTLDQLFRHRDGHLLTLQAYHKIGSVKGALSQHAERTYQELPSPPHQTMARALFVRLLEPGITEQDTIRRRAVLSEFDLAEASEKQQMRETLEAFVQARLLTTSQNRGITIIEISHEAVIGEWKRLTEWLNEAREDIRFQHSLSEDVTEWDQRKRPQDRLYRGVQLKEAKDWAKRNKPSEQETAFLRASVKRRILSLVSLIVVTLLLVSLTGVAGWYLFFQPQPTLVTTLQDEGPGSLRWCVDNAPTGSTIRFKAGMSGTIKLTGGTLTFQSGKQLTLVGPGENQLAISGGNQNAVIHISQKATLNVSGLSFKDSLALRTAFLHNEGTLVLIKSIISNNKVSSDGTVFGGGIYNEGTLTVINSTISGNIASSTDTYGQYGQGGGIDNAGTLMVTNSTISKNMAMSSYNGGYGGGIENDGKLIVTNCTISGNTANGPSSVGGGGGIYNGSTLTVIDSTISNNIAKSTSDQGLGGGIFNNKTGKLTVTHSTILNNTATSSSEASNGGGIHNRGMLTVTNSILANNTASSTSGSAVGGGIENNKAGKLAVTNSTLANNTTTSVSDFSNGGGVHNEGVLTITNSTLANNVATSTSTHNYSRGGGIFNYSTGKLTVTNSTLSNNTATSTSYYSQGGGIFNQSFFNGSTGKLTLINSTLSNNIATSSNNYSQGGGIFNNAGSSDVTLGTSIVAANTAQHDPDISGSLTSGGYNLIQDTNGVDGLSTTDRQVTPSDLKLDPTLRNDGPTQTLALLPGSLAIDAVPLEACHIIIKDASGSSMTIATDQRGNPRPDGSEQMCDIGAYESSY